MGQRAKSLTPTRAIDALKGEEERKTEEKETNRERDPNPVALDHLVASYDPYGSYGGPILNPPSSQAIMEA